MLQMSSIFTISNAEERAEYFLLYLYQAGERHKDTMKLEYIL